MRHPRRVPEILKADRTNKYDEDEDQFFTIEDIFSQVIDRLSQSRNFQVRSLGRTEDKYMVCIGEERRAKIQQVMRFYWRHVQAVLSQMATDQVYLKHIGTLRLSVPKVKKAHSFREYYIEQLQQAAQQQPDNTAIADELKRKLDKMDYLNQLVLMATYRFHLRRAFFNYRLEHSQPYAYYPITDFSSLYGYEQSLLIPVTTIELANGQTRTKQGTQIPRQKPKQTTHDKTVQRPDQ